MVVLFFLLNFQVKRFLHHKCKRQHRNGYRYLEVYGPPSNVEPEPETEPEPEPILIQFSNDYIITEINLGQSIRWEWSGSHSITGYKVDSNEQFNSDDNSDDDVPYYHHLHH